jgi:hypothetical protein
MRRATRLTSVRSGVECAAIVVAAGDAPPWPPGEVETTVETMMGAADSGAVDAAAGRGAGRSPC